jgi:hypothetical protein
VPERGEHLQLGVEARRRPPTTGVHDGVTADQLAMFDASEVERHPVARPDVVDSMSEALDRAHPGGELAGASHDLITGAQLAAGQRAGDHRATSLGGKHAIDPQSGAVAIGGCRRAPDKLIQFVS